MNKYHKNPRMLTEKQFKLLERDLKELGDLSGFDVVAYPWGFHIEYDPRPY